MFEKILVITDHHTKYISDAVQKFQTQSVQEKSKEN